MREKFAPTSAVILTLYLTLVSVSPDSITLFEDRNFEGDHCDIDVVGCKPVCPGLDRKVSSLKGNATCVNFFRGANCTMYMGSWNSSMNEIRDLKHTAGQDSMMSVGDCNQPIDPANSVSFYEDKFFGGKRCNIEVQGCKPMCPDLENRASSAQGAVCVKIYKEPNCTGYLGVFDFKEGAFGDFKYTTLQDTVASVSDCDYVKPFKAP
nr:PREDICTED: uncharacterized protein LOC109036941 [Bemisia tabaci]XP_018906916.1 PREDICTED: uncharacterized protein LOC109036941 [Bemisia tabaci]